MRLWVSCQSSRGNGDTARHVFVFIMLLSVEPQNIKTHGLNVFTPEHLSAGFKQLLQTSGSVSWSQELLYPVTHTVHPAPAELCCSSHTNTSPAGTGAAAGDSTPWGWLQWPATLAPTLLKGRWWTGRGLSPYFGVMDKSNHWAPLAHRLVVLLWCKWHVKNNNVYTSWGEWEAVKSNCKGKEMEWSAIILKRQVFLFTLLPNCKLVPAGGLRVSASPWSL